MTEVDEQADIHAGCFEKLSSVLGGAFFSDFAFNDDLALDQLISKVVADIFAPVVDANGMLGFGNMAALDELDLHGALVDFFEKAVTEEVVNFEDSTYDGAGSLFIEQCHGEGPPVLDF